MKKHRLVLIAMAVMLLAGACRKSDDHPTDDALFRYTHLEPGNYWVYKTFNIGDTSGLVPPAGYIDSVYVEKDTAINGKIYHKVRELSGTGIPWTKYLRDSSGYLVDHYGYREFSANDFSRDLLSLYLVQRGVARNDSVGLLTRRMVERDARTTVPAGSFSTLTMRETIYYHPDNIYNGVSVRWRDAHYAAGVGKVSEVIPYYTAQSGYTERRLVRYYVK